MLPVSQHLFPYTDFHDLNLDWILQQIKEFKEELAQFEDYGERITQLEVETDKLERDLTTLDNSLKAFANFVVPSIFFGCIGSPPNIDSPSM